MTRFRKLRDKSPRTPNNNPNGDDNNIAEEYLEGFGGKLDDLSNSIEGIGRALSQDDLDIHDAWR